ncbi:MAG: DUF1194 domain-containing protein [Alphaproteobacteria bacterium]|nr:DUF1194 domain-containing protein [Alphaproteobacteria bacterium]
MSRFPQLVCALLAMLALSMARPTVAQELEVDLELVLAIDVSQSVDAQEGRLQRLGYLEALTHPRVIDAIKNGRHGRISITYFEWAGPGIWRRLTDWRVIRDLDSARAYVAELSRFQIARATGTSISGAIEIGAALFDGNGIAGVRRVIDISGDGPNNGGANVAKARDTAVKAGITINGVAINNFDGSAFSLPDLDVYYEECVIGGTNAFVVAANGFESFSEAILRKLILEIADLTPTAPERFGPAQVVPVQAQRGIPRSQQAPKYAPACDIGERMRFFDNPNTAPPPGR